MSVVIDTPNDTTSVLSALKAGGIMTIIRYINPLSLHATKTVKPEEATAIAQAGLRLGLVCEGWGDAEGHGGIDRASGDRDGEKCRDYALTVGAPKDATIYFAVDTDESADRINQFVLPYFEEVNKDLAGTFRVGVYGSGFTCQSVLDAGLARAAWLSCSTGWTGYRAFRDSGHWTLLQHVPIRLSGLDVDPNDISLTHPDIGDFVPFAAGDRTPSVVYDERWLQQALNKLGADPKLNPDGRIGPLSMNAIIRQIQKDLGGV